ncbi:MAG: hypothetical protein GX171_06115, partial [Clostridiales bacterium]|nr:hypothetical protein [Clostridiales bacterium]
MCPPSTAWCWARRPSQLRFADSDKPYLYVPVYELLKVAAEQQEKPLLIEIKAPAQAHLSMSGQMGMVDLGHLKEVPPDPADQESAIQEPNTGTGVTDKPAITQKPTDGQTPVVTKKPVITIKPVITKKPVITDKPVITEKPVITNKPVTSEDPNTITDPPQIDPCADGHNWGKPQPDTTSRKHTLVCQNNPAHTSQVDCDYVTEETPAICDGPGEKAYACSGCGDSYKEAIPAPGHNWGAWVSNKDGTHSRVCKTDTGHTEKTHCRYTDTLTLPTCTEDGFTTHVCQDCGYTTTDTPTLATGHAWGAWVSNKDGSHTRVCMTDAGHTEKTQCR